MECMPYIRREWMRLRRNSRDAAKRQRCSLDAARAESGKVATLWVGVATDFAPDSTAFHPGYSGLVLVTVARRTWSALPGKPLQPRFRHYTIQRNIPRLCVQSFYLLKIIGHPYECGLAPVLALAEKGEAAVVISATHA